MRLTPGSFGWLVAHDLLLSWRGFRALFGGLRPFNVAIIIAGTLIAFHAVAFPLAKWFGIIENLDDGGAQYYSTLRAATIFVLPWLLAQSLTSAMRAVYSRGDIDMLLASPVSARSILGARALAIAIESVSSVAIFLLPIANVNAALGRPHWLAVYPALAADGLIASSLGLFLALGLFVLVGAKRARLISQIVATLIGAAFVISFQVINVLPNAVRAGLIAQIDAPPSDSLLDLPARATSGVPIDLAIWVALAVSLFALAAITLGHRFAVSAVKTGSTSAPARASRRGTARRLRLRGVAASLRRKEWRLLGRDPWLLSQIFMQIVYTLPISIVIWRSQGTGGHLALSVAPAIVVIASQVSASLAWITISSEDAPEFLATAPITRSDIERAKLEAIALPLFLFLAVPIAGLAFYVPHTAAITVVFAIGAAVSTALLNLWHPMPGKRGNVLRRHSQSKLVGLMEHMLSLCWAVAMVLAVFRSPIALAVIALVGLLLFLNRPRRKMPRLELRPQTV